MVSQLLSSFETNGEQQVEGDEPYRTFGDLKITFHDGSKNTEYKKKEGGISKI